VDLEKKFCHIPQHGWNLEEIMLREVNQSQNTNTVLFHLDEVARVVKLTETESRMVATRGWRPLKGYIIPVLQNEKVLKMCCTARRIHY
jgi:hypothetical protein